jgi:hypothetical protein
VAVPYRCIVGQGVCWIKHMHTHVNQTPHTRPLPILHSLHLLYTGACDDRSCVEQWPGGAYLRPDYLGTNLEESPYKSVSRE